VRASVGPTSEQLAYGDSVVTRNLSRQQFHTLPVSAMPGEQDEYGPLGLYGEPSSSGSLYGFGVGSSIPR